MAFKQNFQKIISVPLLLAVMLLVFGCDKEMTEMDEAKIDKNLTSQDRLLIEANNRLSFQFLSASLENNNTANFFFSPVSAGMSLGMLYNGVGISEKETIERIAGFESLEIMEVNKSYNQLLSFMEVKGEQLHISCANSMWFSSDMSINEDYRTTMMAYYDAEVNEINFAKKTSAQYITNWAQLNANNAITNLLTAAPSQDSRIVIINALGLNASWSSGEYFETHGEFTNSYGQKTQIPTININEAYIGLSSNDEYRFMDFDFKSGNFNFKVIETKGNSTLQNLLENLNADKLNNLSDEADFSKVNLSLPKLTMKEKSSLKPSLSANGLSMLFSQKADLTASFNATNTTLTDVENVAAVEMTQPTQLFSVSTFTNPALPMESVKNPFLYFITEKTTGTILFAGYYITPAQ